MIKMGARIPADTCENGPIGIPVRTIHYRNGKMTTKSELLNLKMKNFPSSTFKVPAGYMEKKINMNIH